MTNIVHWRRLDDRLPLHNSLWGSDALKVFAILAGALLAVAAAGCGGGHVADHPQSSSASGTSQATSSSSQPTSAGPRSGRIDLPGGNALYANRETVYTGCDARAREEADADDGARRQYFDTASGEWVPFGAPTLPPGQQLIAQSCVVIAGQDGSQRVVYLSRLKTPSQGLTPESESLSLTAFDGESSSPTVTKPLTLPEISGPSSQWTMYPTVDGFALHGGQDSTDYVYFLNGQTLDITASSTDHNLDAFNAWGYAQTVPVEGYPPTYAIEFKDTLGAIIGRFDDSGTTTIPTINGFLMDHNRKPGVHYFDMRSKQLVGPITPDTPDFNSRFVGGIPAVFVNYEFGDNLLLMTRSYIKVFDTSKMSEVFSLDGSQLTGLHIDSVNMAGNYLYLANETDSPVIDIQTKQPVSKGWAILPLFVMKDGWAVIRPHGPDAPEYTGTCFNYIWYACSKMYENSYLLRKSTVAYDGPWF